jgi:hypothetical protein
LNISFHRPLNRFELPFINLHLCTTLYMLNCVLFTAPTRVGVY